MQIKSFITHSEDLNFLCCSDRMSINLQNNKIAIADGVSRSHVPSIWASILTNSFTESDLSLEEWVDEITKKLLCELSSKWNKCVTEIEDTADEEEREYYIMTREKYKIASSTFIGVEIIENVLKYVAIGDSCLFICDNDNGIFQVVSGYDKINGFTNLTECISSDSTICGEVLIGRIEVNNGYILLMTDALSDWFIKKYKENPFIVDVLWSINNHHEFQDFIHKERFSYNLKDDDITLIIIKLTNEHTWQQLYNDDINLHIKNDLILEYEHCDDYLLNLFTANIHSSKG